MRSEDERAADEVTFREANERIRGDCATFAILRGHSSTGDVVERHEHYVVVTKTDRGGAVARALDPREAEDA